MWGRNIMMGYLNREDKTMEDVDEEGWFHSGDLGVQDEEGFLKITGETNLWLSLDLTTWVVAALILPVGLTKGSPGCFVPSSLGA